MKEYTALADALSGLTGHALLQQPAFADMAAAVKRAKGGALPLSDMKQWVDLLPAQLASWVDSTLLTNVQEKLLQTCRAELEQQFSAGLNNVSALVQRLQTQGSDGFDEDAKNKLLLCIPKAHPLKDLVHNFIEAGGGAVC